MSIYELRKNDVLLISDAEYASLASKCMLYIVVVILGNTINHMATE